MGFTKLSDCCEFLKDGTHSSPIRVREGIPVLSASNVEDGRLNFNTDRFTTEEELKIFRKRLYPQKDDILLTIVGTIGRVAILREDKPFVFQRSVCVIRPKKTLLNSWYLRYVLESNDVKSQLERETHEVAQAGVYLEALNKIEIPLPKLKEQGLIATILTKADHQRQLRRYALELSDTYLQSVFLEMFGDPVTNPKGWDLKTLGDVIYSAQDGPHVSPDYSKSGVPFLSTRNIRPSQVIWEDLKFISYEEAEKHWQKCKPQRGDILYTKGGTTGLAKAIDFDREIAVWVHIALLKLDNKLVDALWLESMLNSDFCYNQSQEFTHGIANHDLGLTRMVKIKLYLPPLSLQREFVRIAKKYTRLLAQQREALRQAEHLFQTLLHKAFQGELSVDEDEVLMPDVEIAHQRMPVFADVIEPLDTDAYQLALPME